MKIVIYGLSVSSSWGNGHATFWRGMIEALCSSGHRVVFFERNIPYYASHRDRQDVEPAQLIIYSNWEEVQRASEAHLADADIAIVTSHSPDGAAACDLVLGSKARAKVFYDLDTAATLQRVTSGQLQPHLPVYGLGNFDWVLSLSGGRVLEELKAKLGARRVAPLYGCADPRIHFPMSGSSEFSSDMSYLGAYWQDRQDSVERLLLRTARSVPGKKFVVGGSQYPFDAPWPENVRYVQHIFPDQHSTFYCSSPLTLSIARKPMAARGHCPSGRIFEASACGVPVVTDDWDGIGDLYEPGKEIMVIHTTQDALVSLSRSRGALERIGRAARDRTLAEHTTKHRAAQLLETVSSSFETRPALKSGTVDAAASSSARVNSPPPC